MPVYRALLCDNNGGPLLIKADAIEDAARRLKRRGVNFTSIEWLGDDGEVIRGYYRAGHHWPEGSSYDAAKHR